MGWRRRQLLLGILLMRVIIPFTIQALDVMMQIKSTHIGDIVQHIKFPCEQCDYKATFKGNLLTHIKSTHEGVKFPCEHCDYKATEKGSLSKHIKSIHEG